MTGLLCAIAALALAFAAMALAIDSVLAGNWMPPVDAVLVLTAGYLLLFAARLDRAQKNK